MLGKKSPLGHNPNMRVAMISYHTCPLATLGGKDTGGMNVYVRDLTRELGRRGVGVDIFTRSQDEHVPHVLHDLGFGNRIVHIEAGPETPLGKDELANYLPKFVKGIAALRLNPQPLLAIRSCGSRSAEQVEHPCDSHVPYIGCHEE